MTTRFLHSSDWQIGKVFRYVDNATMGLLQEARLWAITRLGKFAGEHDVHHILVAGDIYDMEALSSRSLNQPLERMRNFARVQWHLLPGNHDPHRPNGLWDQLLRKGLPDNVHIHTLPAPKILEEATLVLLPAPLHHRRTLDDPTAYMDDVELPHGFVRIGLAHGTVTGFGSDDQDIPNYIAPDRPMRAGLSYLALGDWHGQKKINDRCWYSGTPETDAFDVIDGGQIGAVAAQVGLLSCMGRQFGPCYGCFTVRVFGVIGGLNNLGCSRFVRGFDPRIIGFHSAEAHRFERFACFRG